MTMIRIALDRAIEDSDRGLKSYHPIVDEDAMEYFSTQSQGDKKCSKCFRVSSSQCRSS